MANVFSRLYLGDVAYSSGNLAFRKLQKNTPGIDMDVFFDFKIVGNNTTNEGGGRDHNPFTLANQGSDKNVVFTSYKNSNSYGRVETVEGQGLIASHYTTSSSYNGSGGFTLSNLSSELLAGAKTIAFRLTAGKLLSGKNAQILTPNSISKGSLGIGASNNENPYHAYMRAVGGGGYDVASAVDADYSTNGTHFACFGGAKDIIGRNVIITVGSKEKPSPMRIYVDGELAALFDIPGSGNQMDYFDLTSGDGKLRCFASTASGSSCQDWESYTLSYFGMMCGELTAEEVRTLNGHLNALGGPVDDGNLSVEDGVYEGQLSKVAAFVASKGLNDVLCVADVDGQMFSVPGGELANHFASMGFAAEDIVRFEYPT